MYFFQTLVDWDYHNPYALLAVVEELLRLYKARVPRENLPPAASH
jgi:hypothetical protein